MKNQNGKHEKKAGKPSRLGKWLALLPAGCALLYPLYLAAQLQTVEKAYINHALPRAFHGLKIAYVSDIHWGTFFSDERLQKLIEQVNALEADLIVLGGDYAEDADGALKFWQQKPVFKAKVATLAVLGNHDRTLPESHLPRIQRAMRQSGVIPLVNDVWTLEKEGKILSFAGIDDYYNGHPDLQKVARLCRKADFSVFLPHSPDVLPQAFALSDPPFFQLALCGHTHGGQVALLGWAPISSSHLGSRYLSGWYREKGADILVSNGVGTSVMPVRFGAAPQIHLITLQCE